MGHAATQAGASLGRDEAGAGDGVRGLMLAVLLDAVTCVLGRAGPPRQRLKLAREAREWLRSTDRDGPFSCESICEVLGVSAAYLRTLLLSPPASRTDTSATGGSRRDDILRRLSMVRMRGNCRTHVLVNRVYRRRRKRRGQ